MVNLNRENATIVITHDDSENLKVGNIAGPISLGKRDMEKVDDPTVNNSLMPAADPALDVGHIV